MLEPFNITDSPFYEVIENVYQAIRGGLLEQRETAEMTFLELERDKELIIANSMDRLYQTFFRPARGHHSNIINYDEPSENILIKPL